MFICFVLEQTPKPPLSVVAIAANIAANVVNIPTTTVAISTRVCLNRNNSNPNRLHLQQTAMNCLTILMWPTL